MATAERLVERHSFANVCNWRGASGQLYALIPGAIESFALNGSDLYLLAEGALVRWVGSAHDVIGDAASRTRLRLALEHSDAVFHLAAPNNEVARMSLAWDLEGARPVTALSAA